MAMLLQLLAEVDSTRIRKKSENSCKVRGTLSLDSCGDCCDTWVSHRGGAHPMVFVAFFEGPVTQCAEVLERGHQILDQQDTSPGGFEFARPESLAKWLTRVNWTTSTGKRPYFAAVQDSSTGRALSFMKGYLATKKSQGEIDGIASTKTEPVQGATAWGLSMLLHRLKLLGETKTELVDVSEKFEEPIIIGGQSYSTKGSLVYGRTNVSHRPYTFPIKSPPYTDYEYDLLREGYGEDYPADEAC